MVMVCVGLQTGCAKLKEGFQSFGAASPRLLDSSPDTAGLLLLHVALRAKGSMTLGLGASIGLDGAILVRADTNAMIAEGSLKEMVLFQLPPGTYRLAAVRGWAMVGNTPRQYLYSGVDSVVGPMQVSAGQITYIGHLSITEHSRAFRTAVTYTYEWDRDPAREADALRILEQRYKNSPWIPMVRNRLGALPPER